MSQTTKTWNKFAESNPQPLPAGENYAEFQLTLKDCGAEKDQTVAVLSVRDAQTKAVLAKRSVAAWQFEGQNEWTFRLSYLQEQDDLAVELVVEGDADVISAVTTSAKEMYPTLSWPIGQQLPSFPAPEQTLDYLDVTNMSRDEKALFTTFKGIVNRKKPRIHTCEGNRHDAEAWPEALGLTLSPVEDGYTLLEKYRDEITGMVVFDSKVPATLNLATAVASQKNAVVASPELARWLSKAPYNLPILADYRGRFHNMFDTYRYLMEQWLPGMSHRIMVSLAPETGGCLREYVSAVQLPVIWFDPRTGNDEKYMLDDFLETVAPGGCCMGWWPEEGSGVDAAAINKLPTIPSDFSVNLTVYGGTDRKINIKPMPKKPKLENKIYVGLIMSDGDNLQYVEHRFKDLWDTEERGSIPLGWTLSPALVDAAPGLLNHIYETATENDCLISGPSGMGYTYPNHWIDEGALVNYLKRTEDYCSRAGFRVITIWGHSVCSPTVEHVGNLYAEHVPSILGLTGQRTGGGWRIFDNKLPNIELTGSYCSEIWQVRGVIDDDSKEYDGTKPVFLLVQPVPWSIDVKGLKEMVANLGPEYEVVRPDILFQLYREANGLPVDPTAE